MTAELQAGLEAPSLVELAVRRLRAEIVVGAFAPGERLVEEQLTRRFGISRAPLREALRLLGQQGLVEHLPRRGVRVVALSARPQTGLLVVVVCVIGAISTVAAGCWQSAKVAAAATTQSADATAGCGGACATCTLSCNSV